MACVCVWGGGGSDYNVTTESNVFMHTKYICTITRPVAMATRNKKNS